MSDRLLTRQIRALIGELAAKVDELDRRRPQDPNVTRLMFNTVAASRNIRPLMDPRDMERESA